MAFTLNRRLSQLVDSNGQLNTGKIPNGEITTAMLHSGFTVSSGHLGSIDSDAVAEGSSNLYFTNARVDSHLSGGTGVTYSSGAISIGQAVGTSDSPTFADLTVTGNLTITGDIDSYNVTDLDVTDKTITVGAGQSESNSGGSGLIVDGASASILWDETNDEFDINKGLNVTGDLIVDTNTLKVDVTNNRVGIGNASPDVSLDLGSVTDAVHMPVGSTAQRPSSPAAGYFRYNSDDGQFEGYTTEWGAIAGSGGGASAKEVDNFTGDGSTTAFTLSSTVADEDNLMVFIEGVYQNKADFVASGTTLTFDVAPANGRKVVVHHVKSSISGTNTILDSFTADGSTTGYTLSLAPGSENNTQIFIDGVYQQKTDYTVSGTTLTFDAAPANGAIIEVMIFTQTTVNAPAAGTVTSASIASGDFAFDTNTLAIDATNNRVGIGTTSPAAPLEVNITGAGDAVKIVGNSITDFDFVANPPEFNLEDSGGTSNAKRARLTVDDGKVRIDGLSDDDATLNYKFFVGDLSNGKVGIGTNTPQQLLHLKAASPNLLLEGTNYPALKFSGTDYTTDAEIYYGIGANDLWINNYNDGYIGFKNNNDEAFRIIKDSNDTAGLIQFTVNNIGAPDVTDHTIGTRINYYPSSNAVFYGTGVMSNSLWTMAHKNHFFYIGEGSGTKVARINDEGLTVPNASADGTGTVGTGDQTNSGLEAGMIYYNTTDNNFRGYNGTNWIDVTSGSLTTINGLQLWADVTGGISSTTVTDLSGNNRSGTLTSTSTTGTLNGNTYFDTGSGSNGQYCEYAASVLPDTSFAGSNASSYFFVVTNQRTRNSYASYITQVSNAQAYQIIRHNGTTANYNYYATNLTNAAHTVSNTTTPVNSTINEAYIIIFQFKTVGSNTIIDVYKHENGNTTTDQFTAGSVTTGSHNWTGNGTTTRIGNSSWANEYFNGGFFAWGFTNTAMSSADRTVIYNYYAGKGLAN